MQIPSMPFKVLALAPFRAANDTIWSNNPITVDKTDLDHVMADLELSLFVPIPNHLCPAGGIDIKISRMKDFHPDQLVQKNGYLKNLVDVEEFINAASSKGTPVQEINSRLQTWPGLPPLTLETDTQKPKKKSERAIDNILDMVALPDEQTGTASPKSGASNQVASILQGVLDHIFSNKTFIELESIWRGLRFFLQQGGANGDVTLDIVPVAAETLGETLDLLTVHLVQNLPSLIIVDLPFDNSSLSLEHLQKIAQFSETLMVPALCWITKDFLYIDDWNDFNKLPFLPNHVDGPHYAKWHKLEQSSAGRWLSVTCNRFLSRYPYGKDNKTRGVEFNEKGQAWTAPVWAAAGLLAQSFVKTGWPTRFTDHQNIIIEDLPLNAEHPDKQIPTETFFTNDRLDQFTRIGIMPLACIQNKDIVFTPVETTVAGISLSHQAFLTSFTKCIFWCLDNLSKDPDPRVIEENFKKALSLFWEKSGHPVPDSLKLTAGKKGSDDRMPLRIEVVPPSSILASGEKIELDLAW